MLDEILRKVVEESVEKAILKYLPKPLSIPEKKYIYTMQGLADELHMSIVTAQKLKNSGRIPYKQEGRKVIFELNEVLEAMSGANGRRSTK